jgi:hypothetical protein
MKYSGIQQTISTLALALFVLFFAMPVKAQTSAFTYQGKISDSGSAANGNYDLQFKLYDALSSGTQQGTTVALSSVAVTNGIFAVNLDFGAITFSGAGRFLEISIKPTGSPNPYTVLAPRQQVMSTPYAIKSLNAATADGLSVACVNCVTSSQIQNVQGSQISGAIPVGSIPAGSSNYIQNGIAQQAGNFNISGNGFVGGTLSANIVNVATQYNFGGQRLLGVSGVSGLQITNIFAGIGAGAATTPDASGNGNYNSFFGNFAGQSNTTGYSNTFFGNSAGFRNTTEHDNIFIGYFAGSNNGLTDTTNNANFNTFVGSLAGQQNTTGAINAFFGYTAGYNNSTGQNNAFFGPSAGAINQTGSYNTALGAYATEGAGDLTNSTAIGAFATVSQSNSLVLGSINGVNSANADTNVGIGTTAPVARLDIAVNFGHFLLGNAGCNGGFTGIGFGSSLSGCTNYSLLGDGTNTIINRPTGGQISFREANTQQMSINAGGDVFVNQHLAVATLGSAGSTQLCRNASNQLATCSSSLRYKKEIQPFVGGLALVNRLKPITFKWKSNNFLDLGFGAEDVAAVEPLLVTYNEKGQVEGVKYDRISAALVNAVNEQQTQITQQQQQISQQQQQIIQQAALLQHQQHQLAALQNFLQSRARHRRSN